MSNEREAEKAAKEFRKKYKLGTQPLGNIVTLIEQTVGHDVAIIDADDDEHGMTMRDPESGTIFIAVAATPHPMRQRSSLAHELAHIIFGDWGETDREDYSRRTPEEIRADAFARHLLIPKKGLKEFLDAAPRRSPEITERTLSEVVQRFLVSPAIAAIVLRDLGCIDEDRRKQWGKLKSRKLATRFGWVDMYDAMSESSQRTKAPRNLLARAIGGYTEGVVSLQTVANLRGVSAEEVQAEFEESGIVPVQDDVAWASADELPEVDIDLSDLDDLGDEDSPGPIHPDGRPGE